MTESTRNLSTEPPPSTAGTGRVANVALWVLQVLAAAVFVLAAVPKLTATPEAVKGFTDLGFGTVGMYIIGALEVAGAIGLLIPRLAGLAALAFVGLMIGAVITTLVVYGLLPAVAIPAVMEIVVAIIAWGRRHSLAALVSRKRSHS